MDIHRQIEKIFMHFDDELGVLSATGSGLAGAGLVATLYTPGMGVVGQDVLVLIAGLVLIVLDYFR